MELIHVFAMMLYLGTGKERTLVSGDMHFYSITECNFFAQESAKRYGNYQYVDYMDPKDRATIYCVPKMIRSDQIDKSVKVY